MSKPIILALILSLLVVSGGFFGARAEKHYTMPTTPGEEHFFTATEYSCGYQGTFVIYFYKKGNTYESFWYTKEVEYPIVVIHDTNDVVNAVYIKLGSGEVYFFPSREAAENSVYPDPCDVKATYVNTTI